MPYRHLSSAASLDILIAILGKPSIVLLDDQQLRMHITTALAAEFGKRVVHEENTSDKELNNDK